MPRCQFRLAGLLLEAVPREERTVVQAIAWCQLADAGGDSQAKELLVAEEPKLTAKQLASVASLKKRLVRESSE